MTMNKLFGLLLLSFCSQSLYSQTLAFPEAEGYGKNASGGRGGRVIEVTNLEDIDRRGNIPEGSLRHALNTSGDDPITLVFKVSGVIELRSELKSGRSNMTIAGQTAPGDGICIKDHSIKLSGDNLIIRYIRFRAGDELGAETSGLNIENAKNIIVDHCSMSWAVEECMGFYDNKYTTVQWCILSEGLYNSVHPKGPRGYGSQWGGQYASYHHNLIAHQRSRSPRINGSRAHDTLAVVDFRNNVIFNWGSSGAIYGGEEEIPGGKCETNFVNNYYKPGPATNFTKYFASPSYVTADNEPQGYGAWYFSGNVMEGYDNLTNDNWAGVDASDVGSKANIRSDVEFEVSPITTHSAEEAKNLVLANAGAILPTRDSVDLRLAAEFNGEQEIEGNGIIDSQSEVGGWPTYKSLFALLDTDHDGMPDEYEKSNGLDHEDESDGAIIQSNGYSNLEIYLNSIDGVTGTEEEQGKEVLNVKKNRALVYPNPVSDKLQIEMANTNSYITISNLSGQVIMEKESSEKIMDIDMNSLEAGIYVLNILSNGERTTQKIVKK